MTVEKTHISSGGLVRPEMLGMTPMGLLSDWCAGPAKKLAPPPPQSSVMLQHKSPVGSFESQTHQSGSHSAGALTLPLHQHLAPS